MNIITHFGEVKNSCVIVIELAIMYETHYEKTSFLHMPKRCRLAARYGNSAADQLHNVVLS